MFPAGGLLPMNRTIPARRGVAHYNDDRLDDAGRLARP